MQHAGVIDRVFCFVRAYGTGGDFWHNGAAVFLRSGQWLKIRRRRLSMQAGCLSVGLCGPQNFKFYGIGGCVKILYAAGQGT